MIPIVTMCGPDQHDHPIHPIVVKWRGQFFYFPYPVEVRAIGRSLVVEYHKRAGDAEIETTGELFDWPCEVRSVR